MSASPGRPEDKREASPAVSDHQAGAEESPEVSEADVSTELSDVKRRLSKSEVELKAMSDAMKSTLIDLRTMMQDFDNPFDLLRSMGVDKLVNNAVEQVEDELNKAKREEAKKRMAEEPKGPEKVVTSSAGAPLLVPQDGIRVESPPPGSVSPYQAQPQPATPIRPEPASGSLYSQIERKLGVEQPLAPPPHGAGDPGSVRFLPYEVTQIKERLGRNEAVLKELTLTLSNLIDDLKEIVTRDPRRPQDDAVFDVAPTRGGRFEVAEEEDDSGGAYYEAFVSLIGEYLVLRFGLGAAQQLLLEGLYKGWASPKVVRDVIDVVRSKKKIDEPEAPFDFSGHGINVKVEDKILVTTLLKNIDKPMSPRDESTQLFLLLALVNKAREGEPGRA